MTVRLTPCPACARHVKLGDCSCPFCGAKVACVGPRVGTAGERMSRSALFAAGALGTVLGDESPGVVALYGGFVPIDASSDG
jgi:hypothetical protein